MGDVVTIAPHITIPATTQQAMLSAAGSCKRAAAVTGRAATAAGIKAAHRELCAAADKIIAALSDLETLERKIDR